MSLINVLIFHVLERGIIINIFFCIFFSYFIYLN